MQTDKDQAFRYSGEQHHSGWVSIPLLVESPSSRIAYLTDLLLVYQSGPILSCDQLT